MCPIPKYLRIKYKVNPSEVSAPLLVLAKTIEKVRVTVIKNTDRNKGIDPLPKGSMNQNMKNRRVQKINVITRRGKKFFLSFTCFFLFSFIALRTFYKGG
ncbi:hypothetical protein A3A76_04840 [Candidatus Woesebacteria bacterium RIFCSPLOWO2_01_FULL_39_23]|nr:MAG: hypothetical protein A3E41_01315 [Candidatus Woesebacteria bacterium RIFCSPHIGHO2_12_FULL_38_9]OGM62181.1 MAG: hypothetical protein A3A76_04840 [Candidatus Woesebacteria bacterium RIFCSPLOWO2_01_FULL_39_23]